MTVVHDTAGRCGTRPRARRSSRPGPGSPAPASSAPPPTQIIGAFAASIIFARRAIRSGFGHGVGEAAARARAASTSAVAGSWSSGIFQRHRAATARHHLLESAAPPCSGASVGCSIRSACLQQGLQRGELVGQFVQLPAQPADHGGGHLAGQAQHGRVHAPGGGQRGGGVQHARAGHDGIDAGRPVAQA